MSAVHDAAHRYHHDAAFHLRVEQAVAEMERAYHADTGERLGGDRTVVTGSVCLTLHLTDTVVAEAVTLLRETRAELDKHGYGDFHYTPSGWRDPDVLAMLAKIDAFLTSHPELT